MKKQIRRFFTLAAFAAGAAAFVGLPLAAAAGNAPTCAHVIVTAVGGSGKVAAQRFSAVQTSDLTFHVLLHHAPAGDHLLTLKVYTPHGYLFRTIDVPVTAGQKPGHRHVQGYPHHVLLHHAPAGDHLLTLKVYTPHGNLFRTMDVPVTADQKPGHRHVQGYPYPVPEKAAKDMPYQGQNYPSIDVDFPVAGTSIVNSSLYGRWKIVAFFDGAKTPCGPGSSFQLTE